MFHLWVSTDQAKSLATKAHGVRLPTVLNKAKQSQGYEGWSLARDSQFLWIELIEPAFAQPFGLLAHGLGGLGGSTSFHLSLPLHHYQLHYITILYRSSTPQLPANTSGQVVRFGGGCLGHSRAGCVRFLGRRSLQRTWNLKKSITHLNPIPSEMVQSIPESLLVLAERAKSHTRLNFSRCILNVEQS